MDNKDWVLLFGGAALGYVFNVVGNFTSGPIGSVVGKLRGSFVERNRKAAKASYDEVYAFHSGTRDKYIYALHSWGFVLSYLVMSTAFGLAGFVKTGTNTGTMLAVVSMLLFLMSVRRLWAVVLVLNRVQFFDAYKAAVRERWPDLIAPD